ncbi:MAG TPA: glycosyltransferase family 2 protein [Candidatus Faecousia intestinigallinarum]|nr:glycosyltransferase family 2 protein [Candidatus Faecousia intestinigallinarum]
MKLITFAIPSYNSEKYLCHAVDTILTGGEEVEIIIVNDGSTDATAAIADSYARQYPTIVRAIHKENGGHGSGVNRGLQEATGLYFKVVDSDDWVDEKALAELLATLRGHVSKGLEADLYITNYVYEHVEDNTRAVRRWNRQLPQNRFFGWDEVKGFHFAQIMMMHSLLYRTEAMRASGIVLPEHTFYVDNLYAFQPLPQMRKLYYLDVNLYRYYIGRSDQSITMENVMKRYEQQVRVTRMMFDSFTYAQLHTLPKGLCRYMLHYLGAIMMVTQFSCSGDNLERKEAYEALLAHIKDRDPQMYAYIQRRSLMAVVSWMPWGVRSTTVITGYQALCKIVKLG